MKRIRMKRFKSKKLFRKKSGFRKKNMNVYPMRGGFRL